jgi:sugar lactone lactonase YvrE
MKRLLIGVALLLGVSAVAAQDAPPDEIVIERPGFSPEGIEWDAENGVFLLGSLADGTVYRVTDDGVSTPFIEDEDINVSAGIEVDADRRRLLVTSSDPTAFFNPMSSGIAALGAYDLDTGERLFFVDMTELTPGRRHFANDVAVDAEGSAYVTNSFASVIYKIDVEGNASVFLDDERLSAPFFGLNGIAAHPDGYLIVSVAGAGKLFKVPLESPADMTEIALEQPVGADGVIVESVDSVVLVSEGTVFRLQSDDDFASATVIASAPHEPATTVTLRDRELYVIYAHLGENTTRETFEIVRVTFDAP